MRKNAVITVTLFSRSRWSGYSVFDNGNEASEVTERRLLSISVTEVSFSIWIINNQLLPSKPLRLHNIIKAWNLLGLIKLCIELLCTESVRSSEIENVITRANISSMFIQGFWDRWWIVGTGCLHSQIFDIFSYCLLPLFSWKEQEEKLGHPVQFHRCKVMSIFSFSMNVRLRSLW